MASRSRSEITSRAVLVALGAVLVGAVLLVVWNSRTTRTSTDVAISEVRARSDSTSMIVVLVHEDCRRPPDVTVVETDSSVVLSVELNAESGCLDTAVVTEVDVQLKRVMGARSVVSPYVIERERCIFDGDPAQRCVLADG